jgi:hypothetical protein
VSDIRIIPKRRCAVIDLIPSQNMLTLVGYAHLDVIDECG